MMVLDVYVIVSYSLASKLIIGITTVVLSIETKMDDLELL